MQNAKQTAKKAARIAGKVLFYAIVVVLVVVNLFNIYIGLARQLDDNPMPMVLGYAVAVVRTGSMEPDLRAGDLIIVKRSDEGYAKGDIISYLSETGRSVVTHRVIDTADGVYYTKGEANNQTDPPVTADRVFGKVVKSLEGWGAMIESPVFRFTAVILLLLIFAAPYIRDFIKEKIIDR